MRHFHHAVLDRHQTYTKAFASEPYEAAWAREAIFFLRVDAIHGPNTTLHVAVQISPDGVNWLDEGSALPPLREPGLHFLRVSHFGGWLRLRGELTGEAPRIELTLALDLKE